MKFVSKMIFCASLLSCSALFSQSAITVNPGDAKFLSGCGVRQDDIKTIPNLTSVGQRKLLVILRFDGRECNDLKPFKESRDFLRVFTPPPSQCPAPPADWDPDFVTSAELEYINKVDRDILDKILRN